MPFAFCDAGMLLELPWAKAELGAAVASAAIAIKDFSISSPVPISRYPLFRALCGGFCNRPRPAAWEIRIALRYDIYVKFALSPRSNWVRFVIHENLSAGDLPTSFGIS